MKKKVLLAVAMVCLVAFVGTAYAVTYITIVSGGLGGTYYPLGGFLAEVYNKAESMSKLLHGPLLRRGKIAG